MNLTCGLCLLGLLAPAVHAATPANPVQDLYQTWAMPQAAIFVQASQQLVPALEGFCQRSASRASAQTQWLVTLQAWETLDAAAFGPLLQRRSLRQIDFSPTRPRLIQKALQTPPQSLADLERIGTPAKGLPALEWLLWTQPVQPHTPACTYTIWLAREIAAEAQALHTGFAQPPPPEALSEWVNQWLGGLERLRWMGLEMPLRVANTATPPTPPEFPRQTSGATAAAWAAHWAGLRAQASGPTSLASLLTAQGQTALAEQLLTLAQQADTAMQGLQPDAPDRILAAAAKLATLKQAVELMVAPALGVSVGFSDADGD